MRFATLISWLLTASLGAFMLRTWLARGGLRRERARTGGLPPQLIFGHAGLALSGLLRLVRLRGDRERRRWHGPPSAC